MADIPPTAAEAEPSPRGIAGWLILPMLGTVISPFVHLYGAVESLQAIAKPEFQSYVPTLQALFYVELLLSLGLIVAWIVAAVYLFKHKRQYPTLFNALLLFTLCLVLAAAFLVYALFDVPPDASQKRDIVRAAISCLIWIPYMRLSERVANTFVK